MSLLSCIMLALVLAVCICNPPASADDVLTAQFAPRQQVVRMGRGLEAHADGKHGVMAAEPT